MVQGRVVSFLLMITLAVIIWSRLQVAKKGKSPDLRVIPAFAAVEEAIGRAVELGRPVLYTPGKGEIIDITGPQVLSSLDVLSHIAGLTAKFSAGLVCTIPTATALSIAEDLIRTAYLREGVPDKYSDDMVRFATPEIMAYGVATAGVIHRERVAAAFLIGPFYGESLLIAESASKVGAILIGGTARMVQIPLLVGACDYMLIGEELYAASAYVTQNPVSIGFVNAQDRFRLLTLILVLVGSLLSTFGLTQLNQLMKR